MKRILKFRCPKCNVAWKLSDPNWTQVTCNCGKLISKTEILELSQQLTAFKHKRNDKLYDSNFHSSIVIALRSVPDSQQNDILKTWELSLCPIDLNELKENLNFFDYEPNDISIYPPKRVELKRYNSFLLRKLIPNFKDDKKELCDLINNQLQIENDIYVLDELLIGINQNKLPIDNIALTIGTLIEKFKNNILDRELQQSLIIDFASQYFRETNIRELLLMSNVNGKSKSETLSKIENEINKAANKELR